MRKVFQYWEAVKLMVVDNIFQDSNFLLKTSVLSSATDTYFPWSDRLISFIFEKISAKYPNLNNRSLSCLHSNNKKGFTEWPVQLTIQILTQVLSYFPWKYETSIFLHVAEVLYMYFSVHYTEYLKIHVLTLLVLFGWVLGRFWCILLFLFVFTVCMWQWRIWWLLV